MMINISVSIAKPQEQLEEFLIEGLESGDAVPITPYFWKRLWDRVDSRRQERLAADSNETIPRID